MFRRSLAKKVIIANLLRFSKASAAQNCPFRILLQIIQWLRMVDPAPLEGGMKYLHGWSRRSEIEISSREFPNIYVSCRPAKPEGIGQLKIWGRNIFWPLTDSHVSFSPISSIETLQELGMLSMLNLWMSRTFNIDVSDPTLMVVFFSWNDWL